MECKCISPMAISRKRDTIDIAYSTIFMEISNNLLNLHNYVEISAISRETYLLELTRCHDLWFFFHDNATPDISALTFFFESI